MFVFMSQVEHLSPKLNGMILCMVILYVDFKSLETGWLPRAVAGVGGRSQGTLC